MRAKMDLTGQRFGRLVVLEEDGMLYGKYAWRCQCDCGGQSTVAGFNLRNGRVVSCGCYRDELMSKGLATSHGLSHLPENQIWNSMKQRCFNENAAGYSDYGGRGITVCQRWLESFENFYQDMGPRPSLDHTLEREDTNGNYDPGNCKWATWDEQALNRRNNIKVVYQGRELILSQLARETGLPYQSLWRSIQRGLTGDAAVELIAGKRR